MRRERLPNKRTLKEFKKNFSDLKPGDSFCYHRGNLGEDRVGNSNLEQVATCALALEITEAVLLQKRNGSGLLYLIQKRLEELPPPKVAPKFSNFVFHARRPKI